MILRSLVLTHYQCVTDGQMDTPPVAMSRSDTALALNGAREHFTRVLSVYNTTNYLLTYLLHYFVTYLFTYLLTSFLTYCEVLLLDMLWA